MEGLSPREPDAAWAAVELAVPVDSVCKLLDDPLLLLRLNPCMEFEHLDRLPGGRLSLAAFNESNDCRLVTEVELTHQPEPPQLVLRYAQGIKRESRFQVEATAAGTRLTITEVYATPNTGTTPPADVDHSLLPWLAALRRHLERRARYGALPGHRWLTEVFWPSMPPRHRRIAWLITWTTALEFLIFVAVLAIYLAAVR